jgi:hypothetical protein
VPTTKTIGRVVVAAFAASAGRVPVAAADEIGCERRQPIVLILRIPILDRHVLALRIAGVLQALEKRNGEVLVVIISGCGAEERPPAAPPAAPAPPLAMPPRSQALR